MGCLSVLPTRNCAHETNRESSRQLAEATARERDGKRYGEGRRGLRGEPNMGNITKGDDKQGDAFRGAI